MVEGFPFGRVSVPVESSGGDLHFKVVGHFLEHHVEGGTVLLPVRVVVGDQVTVLVPRLPQLVKFDAGRVDLLQKLSVNRKIVWQTKEPVHKYNISIIMISIKIIIIIV